MTHNGGRLQINLQGMEDGWPFINYMKIARNWTFDAISLFNNNKRRLVVNT